MNEICFSCFDLLCMFFATFNVSDRFRLCVTPSGATKLVDLVAWSHQPPWLEPLTRLGAQKLQNKNWKTNENTKTTFHVHQFAVSLVFSIGSPWSNNWFRTMVPLQPTPSQHPPSTRKAWSGSMTFLLGFNNQQSSESNHSTSFHHNAFKLT